MSNKQVEILPKAADQFSDPTKKSELALAALKLQAESLNKTFDKLSKQNPSLSVEEARSAATALEQMGGSAKHAAGNLNQSKDAAQGLANMIGIQLPQAATQFLAHSSAIGPALSAAFTTVGVIALLEAVLKLPEAFEKIKGSITGWTETARKAYDDLIESNNKARLAILDLDLAFNQAFGKDSADGLRLVDAELVKIQKTIVALQKEKQGVEILNPEGTVTVVHQRSEEEVQAAINRAISLQSELIKKRNELQKQGAVDAIHDQQEMSNWMIRTDATAAEFQKRQREDAIRTAEVDTERREALAESTLQVRGSIIEAEKMLRDAAIKTNEGDDAGLQLMQDTTMEMRWETLAVEKQLTEQAQKTADEWFRNKEIMEETTAEIRRGIAESERILREQVTREEDKIRDAGRRLVDQFAGDMSRMFTSSIANGKGFWQAFKDQGKNAIAALADTFLSTMIKGFLDPFAAKLGNLVFGAAGGGGGAGGSAGGAATGGLIGGISTKSLAAFATNPFTIAAAAGIIGTTAWLKSQAHHEASTFTKTLQDPFGADLDRILHSTETAADKLKDVESAWADFSAAAQQFAQGGSDEALVVKQAFDTLNPLIANIRSDLGRTAANIQAVSPAGPTTIYMQVDGKTLATITLPYFNAKIRNQNWIFAGAR